MLGETYAVHLRLIGKLVGDFLLVILNFFSLGAFVLSQFTRLTHRQTDRRTDRQTLIGKTALHTMQRSKMAGRPVVDIVVLSIQSAITFALLCSVTRKHGN